MSTYNVKESEYPAKSRSARRRQAGVTYTGTSASPVVGGGGTGTPAPVPEHDLLAGITSIDGAYPETARGIHLTAAAADQLKALLTNILTVLTTADTTTPAADNNVFSALRTLHEIANRAISKTEDDTAAGVISFMEGMRSANHDPLSPLGPGMSLRALKDVNGNHTGYWELIVDYLTVNARATFKEILVEQISHVGGSLLLSPASMECTEVVQILDTDGITVTRYRCYMDENKTNRWKVGDQALCQQFLLPTTRRYWRYVVAVGDHYIDLSATDCEPNSDIPQVDDNIIQFGSRTDSARRSAILITSYGDAGPSITMYKNIGVLLSGETSPFTLTNRAKTSIGGTLSRFVGQIIVEGEDGTEYAVSPYKGQWVSGTTAYFNDEYSYNGSTWICKASPTTTVAPADGAYWEEKVSKGDKGDIGATPTTYWLTTPPSITRSSAGAYTPASFSVYAYKSSGPIPELHSGQFVISETEDGSTYVVKYTSSANESGKSYTPTSNAVKSFKVILRKSITDSSVLDEQVIPVVLQGANGTDGVSYILSGNANVVTKTVALSTVTYTPSTLSFYPRKKVGAAVPIAPADCSFKIQGWNGTGWVDISNIASATELTYSVPVSSTYTQYRAQMYLSSVMLNELVVNVVEDAKSGKDALAFLIGGWSSYEEYVASAMYGQSIIVGGYIRTILIEVESLFAKALQISTIADLVGTQFDANLVTVTQQKGMTFPALINGTDTNLNITPQSLPELSAFLSASSLSGTNYLTAFANEVWSSSGGPQYGEKTKISPSYQTIPAGVNSLKWSSINLSATFVVPSGGSGDPDRKGGLWISLYAHFYNSSTYLGRQFMGTVGGMGTTRTYSLSGTVSAGQCSVPTNANRVYLYAQFACDVIYTTQTAPDCTLNFTALPSLAYFSSSTGVYKTQVAPDGIAVARDSNNYLHAKAGNNKMLLSFMGDIDSNSIAQKLLTMSVAANGIIVNVGGYMKKTGFAVGSSITKVQTGVWRIQHDIKSNYNLGPSSYTVHMTIQNGGYNIPGFMYVSGYDTTNYNWTEVRCMNKDGVLIDTEFYIIFMRI